MRGLLNKVALRRTDDSDLLGLMSYELDEKGLAVEVIYMDSACHSNANLLHAEGGHKRYYGIAKALFAYAVQVSLEAGFDGAFDRQLCTPSKTFRKTVTRHIWKDYEELADDARYTPQYRDLCAKRKETIERVFADAKENTPCVIPSTVVWPRFPNG